MSAVDDEPTTNGFDYDSETASLNEDDKKHIEASILAHIPDVVRLRTQEFELPETVSLITCPDGSKVYLVGTAHFSEESINDVVNVMSRTHPDFVVVELCQNRSQVLTMDEEKIKQEIRTLSLPGVIKSHGLAHGIWQYLLMRLNGHLIDMLGMAPGGEFRAAAQEAWKQPHCHIVLGDRLVNVTLRRAFDSLGPWMKLKLIVTLLFDFEPITKEQVEEMKKSDFLEKLFLEMAGEHPELIRILVEERDMYLAKSIWSVTGMPYFRKLQNSIAETQSVGENDGPIGDSTSTVRFRAPLSDTPGDSKDIPEVQNASQPPLSLKLDNPQIPSCCPYWPSPSVLPRVIVAVVGIGHVNGIKKHWASAEFIDQRALTTLLDPPMSWKLFKWGFRCAFVFAVAGVGYGIVLGSYRLASFLCTKFK